MILAFAALIVLSVAMAFAIPNILIRHLRNLIQGQPEAQAQPDSGAHKESDDDADIDRNGDSHRTYKPSLIDIVATRIMISRSKGLPPDLVDAIFDFAEYWAHSTCSIDYNTELQDHMRIGGGGPGENKFLLRSFPLGLTAIHGDQDLAEELAYDSSEAKPLALNEEHDREFFANLVNYPTPRLLHPCRKIVFSIRSHDQGWGGEFECKGTYKSSWTWFEAGLERFDASQSCDIKCTYDVGRESEHWTIPRLPVCGLRPVHPLTERGQGNDRRYVHPLLPQEKWVIQHNKTATSSWQDHRVTWSYRDCAEPDTPAADVLEEQGRGRATADGTFVRSLKLGDVVTIWGKVRFGAWENCIESVRIDLYWAV